MIPLSNPKTPEWLYGYNVQKDGLDYDNPPVLFWRNKSPFSNWFRRDFSWKGIKFNCLEQFMMYQKATLFNDQITANKILQTKNPSEQKALGRSISDYVDADWAQRRLDIVTVGLCQKFVQNTDLKQVLLDTQNRIIAEASPVDSIWGIGMAEEDPLAQDPNNWSGLNLLGKALMNARHTLSRFP